jgi:hypothetical protein
MCGGTCRFSGLRHETRYRTKKGAAPPMGSGAFP